MSPEQSGSSPRARGTLRSHERQPAQRRFIPASAGNTSMPVSQTLLGSVHPRERGEHRRVLVGWSRVIGSSPRARGTPAGGRWWSTSTRFIPASAGNTGEGKRAHVSTAVHPRERGEHLGGRAQGFLAGGSSPRARGTRSCASCRRRSSRFIPASAGNTQQVHGYHSVMTVHPRERGEHGAEHFLEFEIAGSSPRARGTPHSAPVHS